MPGGGEKYPGVVNSDTSSGTFTKRFRANHTRLQIYQTSNYTNYPYTATIDDVKLFRVGNLKRSSSGILGNFVDSPTSKKLKTETFNRWEIPNLCPLGAVSFQRLFNTGVANILSNIKEYKEDDLGLTNIVILCIWHVYIYLLVNGLN